MSELFVYIFFLLTSKTLKNVRSVAHRMGIKNWYACDGSSSVPAITTLALRKQLHKQHANFAMVHANIKLAKNPE